MLLAGTALTAQPLAAGELPTGGSVVHGSVGISTPVAGRMAIRQSSQNAIVSWQGFSIGADSAVDIRQPSASSAILNRVTGATPSTIAGQLTANGQVYLVNPNGIAITNSGSVEAGAFVASTLDISNEDFLSGKPAFRGDGQSAGVSNAGTIQIGRGGYAALIGGQVENSGTISVPVGRIGLGAGEMVTLDVSGDGFLSVAIPSDSPAADALVESGGQLSADGGRIEISAATARQAARHAINLSGVVEARTVSGRSGEIVLSGGPGGSVSVSGRLDASAPAGPATEAPMTGGAIDITGAAVALAGADIDASGTAGGGTIRIGGDYQGGGDLPRAWVTSVDAETRISADALEAGDGGRVILWSDDRTGFAGEISARGGPGGGDGGFAEVSGKGLLGFTGRVDLTAPAGVAGTLLLDPFDILIAETADDQNQNIFEIGECCPFIYEPETVERGPGTSVIDPDDLMAALESADVLITNTGATGGNEEGDITVAAALEWSSGLTLSLSALDDIIINEAITISPGVEGDPGGLNLFAGDGILLNAPITGNPGLFDGATLLFLAQGSIAGTGPVSALSGDVVMSTSIEGGGGGSIDVGAIAVGDGELDLVADGSVAFDSVSAPGGGVDVAAGSDITTGTVTAAGGDLTFDAGGLLTVGGPITAANGDLFLEGTDIVLENSVSLPGGDLFVLANGTSNSDGTITTTSEGAVSVGSFFLDSGFPGTSRWVQNGASLPAFEATDFAIFEGASFQRTVGGSGTDADPFLVADVYGLQGMDSAGFDDQSFALASDIDASGTAGWNDGSGFNPIGEFDFATTPFSGKLDGRGHTISGLFINRPGFSEGPSEPVGLFGLVLGEAEIRNLGLLEVEITGANQTGALAGALATSALVEDVFVSGGSVRGVDSVGGLVGQHFVSTPQSEPPAIFLTIRRAFADVAVEGSSRVGGLVGLNEGTIELAYSSGSVSGGADVGGLVGFNDGGMLNQTYAVGPVSSGSDDDLTDGGLVGSGSGEVTGSFWDLGATGQADSRGGTGLTTAAFRDTQGFIALAEPLGWDFELDWAPPAPGFYPALYALEPVVRVVAGDDTATYGNPATFDPAATVFGGPGIFVFDEAGDSLSPTITLTTPAFPDGAPGADVGAYPITPQVAGLTSADGITYRAVLGEGTLTLDPATLTVVPRDVAKTYGDTYTFSDADFTVEGLTNEDEISVTLTSPGAEPDAPVAGNDYEIEISEVAIVGADETDNLGNYVLGGDGEGFPTGLLTVEPRPLTIAASDLAKLLGSELVFHGTEFSAEGLAPGDSISTVSLTSEGAAADAPLEGNPYSIFVGDPEGTGLFSDGIGNYDITFVPGELIVHSPLAEAGFESRAAQFAPEIVLPDPADQIAYGGGGGGGGGPVIAYPGARTDLLAAVATLDTLEGLSDDLEAAVKACHESQPNLESYLDCIGNALDEYAAQIDMIALDLPEPLRGVSATIQQASREIAEARDTAVRRLATARTDAERTQIRREAATRARAAVETAVTEIRKSIALIRAEEPQVARVQAEQGNAITAALEMVGSDLERVVGL